MACVFKRIGAALQLEQGLLHKRTSPCVRDAAQRGDVGMQVQICLLHWMRPSIPCLSHPSCTSPRNT